MPSYPTSANSVDAFSSVFSHYLIHLSLFYSLLYLSLSLSNHTHLVFAISSSPNSDVLILQYSMAAMISCNYFSSLSNTSKLISLKNPSFHWRCSSENPRRIQLCNKQVNSNYTYMRGRGCVFVTKLMSFIFAPNYSSIFKFWM